MNSEAHLTGSYFSSKNMGAAKKPFCKCS